MLCLREWGISRKLFSPRTIKMEKERRKKMKIQKSDKDNLRYVDGIIDIIFPLACAATSNTRTLR